jgi:hypothetical protein
MQTHTLITYKWIEKLNYKLMATQNNDGCLFCTQGFKLSLQKDELNNAVNILCHMDKRAGDTMRYVRRH